MPWQDEEQRYKSDRPHDFWQSRLREAAARIQRPRQEAEWYRWAKAANMEEPNRLHFAEAARRDIRLDVLGEQPSIGVTTFRHSDSWLEPAMTKLAEVEMAAENNWAAIVRVADDASLAGIGWLRAEWAMPADYEPPADLSPDETAVEVQKAHQELLACLQAQPVQIDAQAAHYIYVQVLSDALGDLGLSLPQRAAINTALEQHQAALPVMPAHGFRLKRVHPADMLWDASADEWRDIEWVAERHVMRLADIRANAEFKNTSELRGKHEVRQPGYRMRSRRTGQRYVARATQTQDRSAPQPLYEVLWYIHDLRENRLIVIAEDNPAQKPLVEKDWPYPDVIYYPLVFDHETSGLAGISDYRKIEFSAAKREEIQLRWVEHLALHSRAKLLHTPEFVDAKGVAQITDPNRVLCEVKNLSAYTELQRPQINPDAYKVDGVMQENINRMLGSTDMGQGVGRGSGSATEASIMDAARGRVVRERRKKVSSMLVWAVRLMFKCYKEFATERVCVEKGASPSLDLVIDPADLTGDIWVTADTDSLSAANAELEKQQTRQGVETITASEWIMQALGTRGRAEVLEKFLRTHRLVRSPRETLTLAMQEAGMAAPLVAEAVRTGQGPQNQPEPGPGQASGNLQAATQTLAPGQPQAGNAGGAGGPTGGAPAMPA